MGRKAEVDRKESEMITASSGNVFADLGRADAEEQLAKVQLLQALSKAIKARNLSQRRIAEILGIDQPKVSELLKGRTRGYSLERLIHFLVALDQDVTILVQERSVKGDAAHLTVLERSGYAG